MRGSRAHRLNCQSARSATRLALGGLAPGMIALRGLDHIRMFTPDNFTPLLVGHCVDTSEQCPNSMILGLAPRVGSDGERLPWRLLFRWRSRRQRSRLPGYRIGRESQKRAAVVSAL